MIAKQGLCGMDLVEIAPPYDVSDMTAQLGCRVIMDVLDRAVTAGRSGRRAGGLCRSPDEAPTVFHPASQVTARDLAKYE
jgi:hypothetical protein